MTDLEIALDIIRRLLAASAPMFYDTRTESDMQQAEADAEELLARYPQLHVEIPKDN